MTKSILKNSSMILIKKTLTVIIIEVFLFTGTFGWAKEERLFSTAIENKLFSSHPADNTKLAPPSKLESEDFKYSLTVGAICKHVEHDGNLDDKSYLNDVLARLDAEKSSNITVLPHEIIIEIPNEGLAIRYFDPTKANVITPYSDISKLSTKIRGPRLNRQIIHRIKALPPLGSRVEGVSTQAGISNKPQFINVIEDEGLYKYLNPAFLPDGSLIVRCVKKDVDTSTPHASSIARLIPIDSNGLTFKFSRIIAENSEDPRVMYLGKDGWGLTFTKLLKGSGELEWKTYFVRINENGSFAQDQKPVLLGNPEIKSKDGYIVVLDSGETILIDRANIDGTIPAIQFYKFNDLQSLLNSKNSYWAENTVEKNTIEILSAGNKGGHVGFNTIAGMVKYQNKDGKKKEALLALIHRAKVVDEKNKKYITAVVLFDPETFRPLGEPVNIHEFDGSMLGDVAGVVYETAARIEGDKLVSYAGICDSKIARYEEPLEAVVRAFFKGQSSAVSLPARGTDEMGNRSPAGRQSARGITTIDLSSIAIASQNQATEAQALDQTNLFKGLLQLLDDVILPAEGRIFFVPVKGSNISPYHTTRSDVLYAFKGANFKNIKVVFYDGTEEDLMKVYIKTIGSSNSSGSLCLAYIDSNQIDENAFRKHSEKDETFKWIRENVPQGVLVEELFMHVALGLLVLDYVKNSSDFEHKKKLLEIIEKMVDNDEKDIDLLKVDLNNIFSFSFILKLKKITMIDINKDMHSRERSLAEILTAA
ncbi:MAG: hypothetical protein KJ584_05305 [Candidatus Omnitrophica bacterium]|nr:hypothetical protein [Candidatus Omnitrophota bacterium]